MYPVQAKQDEQLQLTPVSWLGTTAHQFPESVPQSATPVPLVTVLSEEVTVVLDILTAAIGYVEEASEVVAIFPLVDQEPRSIFQAPPEEDVPNPLEVTRLKLSENEAKAFITAEAIMDRIGIVYSYAVKSPERTQVSWATHIATAIEYCARVFAPRPAG